MRASIPTAVFFAALASAAYTPDQEAALASIMSELDALTSNPAYTPFAESAGKVAFKFYKTQTIIPSVNPNPTTPPELEASLDLSFAYMSEIAKFAETQTIITGELKATVTSALKEFVSIMSEIDVTAALETETGKVTGTAFSTGEIETTASQTKTLKTVTSKATSSSATSIAASSTEESMVEETVAASATESGAANASGSAAPDSGALEKSVSRMFAGAVAGVMAVALLL
jgi:hypothetical protein